VAHKNNGYNPRTKTALVKENSTEYVIVGGSILPGRGIVGHKLPKSSHEFPEENETTPKELYNPLLLDAKKDMGKYGEWSKFRYALGPQIRKQLKREKKRTDSATAIVAVYSVIYSYCYQSAKNCYETQNTNSKPDKKGCYAAIQTIADKAATSWRVAHNSIKWLVSHGYVHDETPNLTHEAHTLRVEPGLYLLEKANKQYQADKERKVYKRRRIRQL
jgi:hypothetical protein